MPKALKCSRNAVARETLLPSGVVRVLFENYVYCSKDGIAKLLGDFVVDIHHGHTLPANALLIGIHQVDEYGSLGRLGRARANSHAHSDR